VFLCKFNVRARRARGVMSLAPASEWCLRIACGLRATSRSSGTYQSVLIRKAAKTLRDVDKRRTSPCINNSSDNFRLLATDHRLLRHAVALSRRDAGFVESTRKSHASGIINEKRARSPELVILLLGTRNYPRVRVTDGVS